MLQNHPEIPAGHVGERLVQRGAHLDTVFADAPAYPDPTDHDALVVLGSYESAFDDAVAEVRRGRALVADAVAAQVPVLGICFGAQTLSTVLGGTVHRTERPEIAWVRVAAPDATPPPPDLEVITPGPWLAWHHDAMTLPPGAVELGSSEAALQAFYHGPHLGVQFHPEATMESTSFWASHDEADGIPRAGTTREHLLAESSARAEEARQSGYALADAFLAHSLGG